MTTQSGTVYDGLLEQIDENTKSLKELDKAVNNKDKQILEGSIQLTQMSKHVVRIEAQNSIMKKHIWKLLDSFEARFDKDPSQFVAEELLEYIDTAKYQMLNFGRTRDYIVAVHLYLEKLDA